MAEVSESLYFRDISRYPVLTLEEEEILVRKVQQGDKRALHKLIVGNLRFVVSIARRYQGRGLTLLELINEGNLGLYKGAKRFDPTREVKFISYAVWWIRQSIQKALFDQVGSVRIPPNKLALVSRFRKALVKNHGDYQLTIQQDEFQPYEREIAEVMEKIVDVSLDSPSSDDGQRDPVSCLMDLLGSEASQGPDTEKADLQRSIDELLGKMSEREEKVIRMYYGLNYSREFTLDEIGRELKLTRERVRQIKNKSLKKLLRSKESKDKLLPYSTVE